MNTKAEEPSLEALRQRRTEFQLKLLDQFWEQYRTTHEWPIARVVYSEYGKAEVRSALSALGGNVVREERDQRGHGRLHLSLLGILLTSDGVEAEKVLKRYLEFHRDLFRTNPGKDQVAHTDVQQALGLSNEDTALLGELIFFGSMYGGSGGRGDSTWSVSAMKEAEDFPKTGPLDDQLRAFVLQYYKPDEPVFQDERDRRPVAFQPVVPLIPWAENQPAITSEPEERAERADDGPLKRRYQVFVSSTYSDLIEERKHVMQALLVTKCIPSGMELFPAANMAQWNLIRQVIDDCDYYVVIVAGRYGSIGPNGKSYTEMEFDYAVSVGKPIIGFFHSDIRKLPGERLEESEDSRRRLAAFTEKLKQRGLPFMEQSGRA